ncbi:MAG: hypothetical protein LBQ60_06930 [Bacteroidales bacterium]|jgi:translation elongation factor EF-1beta|nr:hypothetical protein [Bacteroidales bacterium]
MNKKQADFELFLPIPHTHVSLENRGFGMSIQSKTMEIESEKINNVITNINFKKMRNESKYSKAKENSMVLAFSISIVIKIFLSDIHVVPQYKILFEVIATAILVLLTWKVTSKVILCFEVWRWRKKNSNFDIGGKWYVLHYYNKENESSTEKIIEEIKKIEGIEGVENIEEIKKIKRIEKIHNDYIRIGIVNIHQKMDVVFLDQGQNYIPIVGQDIDDVDLDKLTDEIGKRFMRGSAWHSTNEYRLLDKNCELSGLFNVEHPRERQEADGVHLLTVLDQKTIGGRYYNAISNAEEKPIVGEIWLYKDKDKAKGELLKRFKNK